MALTAFSLKLSLISLSFAMLLRTSKPNCSLLFKLPLLHHSFLLFHSKPLNTNAKARGKVAIPKVGEESQESMKFEAEKEFQLSIKSGSKVEEFGTEIKKTMMERKEEKEGDLWSGVVEEVQEIEWPAFGKY